MYVIKFQTDIKLSIYSAKLVRYLFSVVCVFLFVSMLCCVVSCCVVSCRVVSCLVLCRVVSCRVMLCKIMSLKRLGIGGGGGYLKTLRSKSSPTKLQSYEILDLCPTATLH